MTTTVYPTSDTSATRDADARGLRSVQSLGTSANNGDSQGESDSRAEVLWPDAPWRSINTSPRAAPPTGAPSASGGSDCLGKRSRGDASHAAFARVVPLSTPETEREAWTADMEYVWRTRMRESIRTLDARARRRRRQAQSATGGARIKLLRSAEWAENRARSLAMSRADRVRTCRERWRAVRCGCGTLEIPVGCDAVQLCAWCRKRHWRKWRHRITRSMEIHLRAALASWNRTRQGMQPGIYLVTLTGPHTGDVAEDRARLGAAWRKLTKSAHAGRWWGAYALTWEVTPGKSGTPHVHAHIACVSSWIPYDELHDAWRVAMPGAMVLDVQAPNRTRNQSGRAANYLAKYVTKGIEPGELTGQQAGSLLVAFHGRRKVTTSAHFWFKKSRECPKCGQRHVSDARPRSLAHIAPSAVLNAFAERFEVWIPRGQPQVGLRFPDGS